MAQALLGTVPVTLLDCDVEEPNDHIYMRGQVTSSIPVTIPVPIVDKSKCTLCGVCRDVCAFNAIAVLGSSVLVFNELCHGCGACSRLCPAGAITEEAHQIGVMREYSVPGMRFFDGLLTVGQALAPPIIRRVKEHTGAAGVTIIDASPGTSCPVVEAVKDSDFCVLVTEPTPFGLNDLRLAVETMRELNTPHAAIINRVGVGDARTEEYCKQEGIPILMTIPLDERIARSYSRGIPLLEALPEYRQRFLDLYQRIVEQGNETDRRS